MKRSAVLLLVFCLLLTHAAPALGAEDGAGYRVEGVRSGDALTVTVRLMSTPALVGRLALAFDPGRLALRGNGDTLTGWLTPGSGVVLTAEQNYAADLVSLTEGRICFAWYASANAGLADGATVATFSFDVIGELNAKSLTLGYVADSGLKGWDSAAYLFGTDSAQYKHAAEGFPPCRTVISYPGSDVPAGWPVTFTAAGEDGKAVEPVITVGAWEQKAAGGRAEFRLEDGSYAYSAALDGYGRQFGTVTVSGGSETVALTLFSDAHVAQKAVDELEIGYAAGDGPQHVSQGLTLPETGYGEAVITWESDKPDILNGYGGIVPAEKRENVTLTATAVKGEAAAARSFTLTVLAQSEVTPPPPRPQGGGEEAEEPISETSPRFRDMEGYGWAAEAVEALAALDVVRGTGADTFSPASPVSRGDFTALLLRLLSPAGEPGPDFDDVPTESYYHGEIALARGLGIAKGAGGNCYKPLEPVSRQDMMVLTDRGLSALGARDQSTDDAVLSRYPDGGEIAAYARESVARMTALTLIQGDNAGLVQPCRTCTRAEAAVLLYRLYLTLEGGR